MRLQDPSNAVRRGLVEAVLTAGLQSSNPDLRGRCRFYEQLLFQRSRQKVAVRRARVGLGITILIRTDSDDAAAAADVASQGNTRDQQDSRGEEFDLAAARAILMAEKPPVDPRSALQQSLQLLAGAAAAVDREPHAGGALMAAAEGLSVPHVVSEVNGGDEHNRACETPHARAVLGLKQEAFRIQQPRAASPPRRRQEAEAAAAAAAAEKERVEALKAVAQAPEPAAAGDIGSLINLEDEDDAGEAGASLPLTSIVRCARLELLHLSHQRFHNTAFIAW